MIFISKFTENTLNPYTNFAYTFISVISNINTHFFLLFLIFTISSPFRGKKNLSITYLEIKVNIIGLD